MKKRDKFIGGLALLGGAVSLCATRKKTDDDDLTPAIQGMGVILRPNVFVEKITEKMEPKKKILIRKAAENLINGFMGIGDEQESD